MAVRPEQVPRARRGVEVDPRAAAPPIRLHAFFPARRREGRLLCCVHGATSDPVEQIQALVPLSARYGVPLFSPEFPRPWYRGFQRLASQDAPLGAAHAFHVAAAGICAETGTATVPLDLMGFSAGAQFIHRYAMLFPERVRRLVVAAPGWYTYLDEGQPFPVGIAPGRLSGGLEVNVDAFLRIPIRVMVGERDVEQDTQLRSTAHLDVMQGEHRLERAIRWVEHLRAVARRRGIDPDISLELLPRVGHSFREATARARYGERAFGFLYGQDRFAGEAENA
jgi:pimeloyl-ACP methyl ester carboxylesterase